MTIHTSVFHPAPVTTGTGDCPAVIASTGANDPDDNGAFIGILTKSPGKTSLLTRYDLTDAESGPAIPLNGQILVTKALLSLKVKTTAVVIGGVGVINFSIMDAEAPDAYWLADGFDRVIYPLRGDLPYVTDASDVVIANRMYQDVPIQMDWGSPDALYNPTTFAAGNTWHLGKGYAQPDAPPDYWGVADLMTDLVTKLNSYVQESFFQTGASYPGLIGFAVDPQQTVVGTNENFEAWLERDFYEPGMVLTIEWDDLVKYEVVVRADSGAGSRLKAGQTLASDRVMSSAQALERVSSPSLTLGRIAVAGEGVRDRVSAPLSHAISRQDEAPDKAVERVTAAGSTASERVGAEAGTIDRVFTACLAGPRVATMSDSGGARVRALYATATSGD